MALAASDSSCLRLASGVRSLSLLEKYRRLHQRRPTRLSLSRPPLSLTTVSKIFAQLEKPETLHHTPIRSNSFLSPVLSPAASSDLDLREKLNISRTFAQLKKRGKVAFIPYITAGDPDLSTTSKALRILDHCGADVIELGIPHSDPIVDGPVIQASAQRALARGTDLNEIFSMLREVIPQISCPITLFSYYNPLLKHGVSKFLTSMKDAGVHGLIVPDLPFEETKSIIVEAKEKKLELVLLTTPTTSGERMKDIVEASEGFVYLVSHVGVTGTRASINPDVQFLLQKIKKVTTKPVAVGFGISTLDHVKMLSRWGADGIIVGSAIVKRLGEANSPKEGLKEIETFIRSLKSALC